MLLQLRLLLKKTGKDFFYFEFCLKLVLFLIYYF